MIRKVTTNGCVLLPQRLVLFLAFLLHRYSDHTDLKIQLINNKYQNPFVSVAYSVRINEIYGNMESTHCYKISIMWGFECYSSATRVSRQLHKVLLFSVLRQEDYENKD